MNTGDEFQFMPASVADFEFLHTLRLAAMRESLEHIGRFDPQRSRERFLANFDPAITQHIARGAERIGFVAVRHFPDHLFLNHLYIHPAHQGRGFGAWALGQVLLDAQKLKLPVRLGALRDSEANRFYLCHGFVQTHEDEFDIYYEYRPRPANAV